MIRPVVGGGGPACLKQPFGASVPRWPEFPDSAGGLRLLGRHYKLAILSNVDRDGIAASMRKLGVEFDAVYTAQEDFFLPFPRTNCQPKRPLMQRCPRVTSWSSGEVTLTIRLSCTCRLRVQPTPQ